MTASSPSPMPTGTRAASRSDRPSVTELRLSAFAGHRGAAFPLGPLTLLAGPSGSGKTTALRAYEALARLGGGARLDEAFPAPHGCVPERARPDAQRRRGFRLGCTADGPEGPIRLDIAVQAEPELRIVGERLTSGGLTLLETALVDPSRPVVQAAWHTAGASPVTRGPLPDDRLGTALLPLRVAGKTDGQRRVLAAAEQMVVALRSVFACDPRPRRMRDAVPLGSGRLLRGCDNLADVLWRTRTECGRRHAQLVAAVRDGCAGPVADLLAELAPGGHGQRGALGVAHGVSHGADHGRGRGPGHGNGHGHGNGAVRGAGAGHGCAVGPGLVRAVLDRGDGVRTPLALLGDGELRYLALALVLFTGPGVLEVDPVAEVPAALQTLTVLADGLDRCLDPRQRAQLLCVAARMGERGHIRLVGAVSDASWAAGVPGATVVHLDRERS
ncbi:ATP-binding protein [Streptomyces neyagawaensis]|uniref:ATP-binding protein n=1 Tax=Streptomyces neyagawaensis TaxID=42238 RepID=UPI00201CBE85|nr:ATP-binding protein [Streptomyces neyagawaensis]MCL6731298.1 ATP-binding protein [Streptomyces neyagawaensis]MDE1683578.1 ATP-binding protein [Streptomyces neyagawaensis]